MFWILWLPLSVLCLGIFITIYGAVQTKSGNEVFDGIGISLAAAFLFFLVGGSLSDLVAKRTPAQSVYVDLENVIYLAPVPNGNEGEYLYSDGDIENSARYIYYYITSQPVYPEYPQDQTILMSQARVVYDSPEKPFFAYIKQVCKTSEFWLLSCKSTSPYTVEFHLPPNSIIPLPK